RLGAVAAGAQHGQVGDLLEDAGAAVGDRAASGEVPYRCPAAQPARAEGVLGDAVHGDVRVRPEPGPALQVLAGAGVQVVPALRVADQVEQGLRVPGAGEVQLRALLRGGVPQDGPQLLREVLVGERVAAGVPLPDRRVQPREVRRYR